MFKNFTDSFIPQRVILAIMGFWLFLIAYTLRSNISLAITQMVIHRVQDSFESQEFRCPIEPIKNTTKIVVRKCDTMEFFKSFYNKISFLYIFSQLYMQYNLIGLKNIKVQYCLRFSGATLSVTYLAE